MIAYLLVLALSASVPTTTAVPPAISAPWRAPNFGNIHTYIGWIVMTPAFGLPLTVGAKRFYNKESKVALNTPVAGSQVSI